MNWVKLSFFGFYSQEGLETGKSDVVAYSLLLHFKKRIKLLFIENYFNVPFFDELLNNFMTLLFASKETKHLSDFDWQNVSIFLQKIGFSFWVPFIRLIIIVRFFSMGFKLSMNGFLSFLFLRRTLQVLWIEVEMLTSGFFLFRFDFWSLRSLYGGIF